MAASAGATIHDERKRRGWSLRRLAEEADLSSTTIHVVESGKVRSLDAYARVAVALDLRPELVFVDERRRDGGSRRDEDPVHAAMGEVQAEHLRRRGFEVSLDEPYQHYQYAGRADLVAWSIESRALLHIENRTRFPNMGETFGAFNGKVAYLPGEFGRRLGLRQGFDTVTHVVVALWSAETLHRLRLRTESFRSVCPASTEAFDRWWSGDVPAPGVFKTLVIFDPLEGQRSSRRRYVGLDALPVIPSRYRGYADALEELKAAGRA